MASRLRARMPAGWRFLLWSDRPSRPRPAGSVVALALGITVVCTLPLFLTGALAVQMRTELQFSVAALGSAIAVFRGSGAVLAAPLGRFADRVGPVVSMRIAAGLAALASIGVAVQARSWWHLCGWLVFSGVANALGQTGANLSLTRVVPRGRQGIAFGLKQSALPIGSLVAGLTVPLIALTVGWRWAFVASAALAVAVGVAAPSNRGARFRPPDGAVNRSQRRAPLVVLAVALFFAMAAASTLSVFIVDASVNAGIPPGVAGLLLTGGSLVAVGTRLVEGHLADRRGRGHFPVVANMLFAGTIGYVLLAWQHPAGILIGIVIAFGLGWGFNGLFWFAIVRLNEATPGRATGMVMPGGMLGGLAGPLAFGWIVEVSGYRAAWLAAAVWALIGGVTMLWGRRLVRADLAVSA